MKITIKNINKEILTILKIFDEKINYKLSKKLELSKIKTIHNLLKKNNINVGMIRVIKKKFIYIKFYNVAYC